MSSLQKQKLQILREKFEDAPDIEELLKTLPRDKTCRIHAAYLFHPNWLKVLLQLIKMLNGPTQSWYEFGMFLDIDPYILQALSYSYQSLNNEDPAHNVLLAFVQHDDATLDKTVDALKKVGRCDIIIVLVTQCNLPVLVDQVVNLDESCSYGSSEGQSEILKNSILRPSIPLPQCPKLLQTVPKDVQSPVIQYSYKVEEEQLQNSSMMRSPEQLSDQPIREQEHYEYGCTAMLTYAEDGKGVAKKVAEELRKYKTGFAKVGVLILDEHLDKVSGNAGRFVTSCFSQVDYVIPIITPGYIKRAVSDRPVLSEESSLSLDNKYVKLIYSTMDYYYTKNGCFNDKIRCLIPDDLVKQVVNHPFMQHPMLQVWNRVSETRQFCERVLNKAVAHS